MQQHVTATPIFPSWGVQVFRLLQSLLTRLWSAIEHGDLYIILFYHGAISSLIRAPCISSFSFFVWWPLTTNLKKTLKKTHWCFALPCLRTGLYSWRTMRRSNHSWGKTSSEIEWFCRSITQNCAKTRHDAHKLSGIQTISNMAGWESNKS